MSFDRSERASKEVVVVFFMRRLGASLGVMCACAGILGTASVSAQGLGGAGIRFSIVNLTNTEALYNFRSTFSGTHFVTPRAYQVQLGVAF